MPAVQFTIRRAESSDAEALHGVYSMPNVIRGTLQLPFPSVETWHKRLAEPPDGTFNLVACVGDEIVGMLGLHTFPHHPRRRHVGQIGMAVRDVWQGKGAGTALMQAMVELADKWLNLSRIELEVYTDNQPAIHLYQKFDFVIEGTQQRFAFRDGEYVDVFAMARFK